MVHQAIIDRAQALAASAGGAWIPTKGVKELQSAASLSIKDLMLALIPVAREFSQPSLSNFQVGAVGLGQSGRLYFGANLELPNCPLANTVHAEQAVVINAFNQGEAKLKKLAVSSPPCGFCRQFLYELVDGAMLQIVLADRPVRRLVSYLPGAFGPADLGKIGGLLEPQHHDLVWSDDGMKPDAAEQAAFDAASSCYAPYTHAIGAVSLVSRAGAIATSSYLENAAFNPSVEPVQAALVALGLSRIDQREIVRAVVVQQENSPVDHAAAAREILRQIAPGIEVIERNARFRA